MFRPSKMHGFTITEIAFTVAIIAILSAIIFGGYVIYENNALKTQISNSTAAYQQSLKSYSLEKDTFPNSSFCLPKNSKCCYSTAAAPTTVHCATDSEAGRVTGSFPTDVSKYVKNSKPPLLPDFATFPTCTAGLMTTGPCRQTNFLYLYNTTGATYTSTDTNAKGFLVYYVTPTFDCGSKDVMTLSGGNLAFQGDPYTRQTGAYRECIVGIRLN